MTGQDNDRKTTIAVTVGAAALVICLAGGLDACAPAAHGPIRINPDVHVSRATRDRVEHDLSDAVFAGNATLDEAKHQGRVGEQPNGYLGIVGKSDPQLVTLVSHINHRRKVAYQHIADSNHTDLIVVEKLAGKRAIEGAAAGQYVRLPSGVWREL